MPWIPTFRINTPYHISNAYTHAVTLETEE